MEEIRARINRRRAQNPNIPVAEEHGGSNGMTSRDYVAGYDQPSALVGEIVDHYDQSRLMPAGYINTHQFDDDKSILSFSSHARMGPVGNYRRMSNASAGQVG